MDSGHLAQAFSSRQIRIMIAMMLEEKKNILRVGGYNLCQDRKLFMLSPLGYNDSAAAKAGASERQGQSAVVYVELSNSVQ